MFDLTEEMRIYWESTYDKDPENAAKELFQRIPQYDHEEVFTTLLEHAYSTYLARARHWEQPEENPTGQSGKPVRHSPAVNPAAHRGDLIDNLDNRPFFVPGTGHVIFKKMTVEDWEARRDLRLNRAAGYAASAAWQEKNISAILDSGVQYSGELSDDVKRDLFDIEPDDPEE
jgi:hypothetical protein